MWEEMWEQVSVIQWARDRGWARETEWIEYETSFLIPVLIRTFPREYLQLLPQIAKRDIKTEIKKEEKKGGMKFDHQDESENSL